MTQSTIDLAQLFKEVTKALSESQTSLNEADSYNNNHGDNMVDIFKTITKAVEKKKKSDAGSAFAYAGRQLKKQHSSGSSMAYAEGLNRAAELFKSKQVTKENAFGLIQALLGGGVAQGASAPGGDVLGALLGNVGGRQQAADQNLDLGDLVSAGMTFLQAQQQGGSAIESLIQAVVSSGALGGSTHRSVSGQLVGNTLMQVLGSLGR